MDFPKTKLRGMVEIRGDVDKPVCFTTPQLAKLPSQKGVPRAGEELSHLKQTRKNGMCTGVHVHAGDREQHEVITTKPHTL